MSQKKRASRLHQTHIFLASNFWAVVIAGNTSFSIAAAPSNERLAYVKHTFSTNRTPQRSSRLHLMHISKINKRLVYTKRLIFWENDIWPTPNTYFGYRIAPSGAIEDGHFKNKMSSRLHRMLVFWENCISPTPNTYLGSGSRHRAPSRIVISGQQLQMHSVKWRPVYVKHTSPKNCTFQRASRLHQMHIRKIECRLVYGKCSFIEKMTFRLHQT